MRNRFLISACLGLASCVQPVAPVSQQPVENIPSYFWIANEGPITFKDTSGLNAHTLSFTSATNDTLVVTDASLPKIKCIVNADSIYATGFTQGSFIDLYPDSYFSSIDPEAPVTKPPHAIVLYDNSTSPQTIVGTDSGIYYYAPDQGDSSFHKGGLQNSIVTALTVDSKHSNVYVGTTSGVIYYCKLPLSGIPAWTAYSPSFPVADSIEQLLWLTGDSLAAIVARHNGMYISSAAGWNQPNFLLSSPVSALGLYPSSGTEQYLLVGTVNGSIGAYSLGAAPDVQPVSLGGSGTIYAFSASTSRAIAGTEGGVYRWSGPTSNTWTPVGGNFGTYTHVTSLALAGDELYFLSNGTIDTGNLNGSSNMLLPTPSLSNPVQQVGWNSTARWVLTTHDYETNYPNEKAIGGFPYLYWPHDTGGLVLLRNDLFANDSSWHAGTLVWHETLSFPIQARVLAHLDSLHVTTNGITTSYPDVLAVRYADEQLLGQDSVPYWIVYYAKNVGPVMFDKVLGTGTSQTVTRLEIQP